MVSLEDSVREITTLLKMLNKKMYNFFRETRFIGASAASPRLTVRNENCLFVWYM